MLVSGHVMLLVLGSVVNVPDPYLPKSPFVCTAAGTGLGRRAGRNNPCETRLSHLRSPPRSAGDRIGYRGRGG